MGSKKVLVKKHKRKGKSVRSHSRKLNKISRKKRKVFTALALQDYETGGKLDFEKGELDNVKLHFGSRGAVEFPHNHDYESSWHTHPSSYDTSGFPSLQDIFSMKNTPEKDQVIFQGNTAISIAEEKKFNNVPNSKIRAIYNKLDNDLRSDKQLVKAYKNRFRKELGLRLKYHPKGTPIQLRSRSV